MKLSEYDLKDNTDMFPFSWSIMGDKDKWESCSIMVIFPHVKAMCGTF